MVEQTAPRPIAVLDTIVSAGIAAGEIIERPVSVIKELIENSVDAGASLITVELNQGGLHRIRVADDGIGIHPDQLQLAFHRHGTSKLRGLEDLDGLLSFGFRGEALPSIAAVAEVHLTSRPDGTDYGTRIHVQESMVRSVDVVPAAPGTIVEVNDLFSAMPARLKYLRSATSEAARVKRFVQHMALASPWIRFHLISDGKNAFSTTGSGDAEETFALIYGKAVSGSIIAVRASELTTYKVSGYLLDPSSDRRNRQGISIFANRRWVTNRAISMAIDDAFRGFLMENRFPIATVFVEVPPNEIDVNVHPSKREVRFARETEVFSSVQRTLRESLLDEISTRRVRMLEESSRSSFTETRGLLNQQRHTSLFQQLLQSDNRLVEDQSLDAPPVLLQSALGLHATHAPRVLGQLGNTYVIAEDADGLVLVDQHAAHESVLYHRLLRDYEQDTETRQPLLDPFPLELTPDQSEKLETLLPELLRFGIHIDHFGAFGWIVRSVPTSTQTLSISDLIDEIIGGSSDDWARRTHRSFESMAASISCHGSIRAGKALRTAEMEALLVQLKTESDSGFCPHGRPTALRVTLKDIERRFGRT